MSKFSESNFYLQELNFQHVCSFPMLLTSSRKKKNPRNPPRSTKSSKMRKNSISGSSPHITSGTLISRSSPQRTSGTLISRSSLISSPHRTSRTLISRSSPHRTSELLELSSRSQNMFISLYTFDIK
jgi:hypothetical protein